MGQPATKGLSHNYIPTGCNFQSQTGVVFPGAIGAYGFDDNGFPFFITVPEFLFGLVPATKEAVICDCLSIFFPWRRKRPGFCPGEEN
jgi:hypothetical protein